MESTSQNFRTITFGRNPECEVKVDDAMVSPFHCRVIERHDGFFVEDLGTTNGTWVRRPGRRDLKVGFMGHLLKLGERVRIGRTILPWEAR